MVPDATLIPATEAEPAEVIKQQAEKQDFIVLRIAVVGIILSILLAGGGVVFLVSMDKEVPDGILAIGSAGVGALATMMVRKGA
ncbi:MAG TPA: hypothetical protein VJQ57_10250 [Acidimicrobiia bacterium]|nr:hypothetical protein [Acidimicrobiia bacterium]